MQIKCSYDMSVTHFDPFVQKPQAYIHQEYHWKDMEHTVGIQVEGIWDWNP